MSRTEWSKIPVYAAHATRLPWLDSGATSVSKDKGRPVPVSGEPFYAENVLDIVQSTSNKHGTAETLRATRSLLETISFAPTGKSAIMRAPRDRLFFMAMAFGSTITWSCEVFVSLGRECRSWIDILKGRLLRTIYSIFHVVACPNLLWIDTFLWI